MISFPLQPSLLAVVLFMTVAASPAAAKNVQQPHHQPTQAEIAAKKASGAKGTAFKVNPVHRGRSVPLIEADLFAALGAAGHRSKAVAAALAHTQAKGGQPKGWAEAVAAIRAEPDQVRQLEIADRMINANMMFAHNGLIETMWTLPPVKAWRTRIATCREFATAKLTLLRMAGWSANDLRVVGIDAHPGHPMGHVIMAARLRTGEVRLLEMRAAAQARYPQGHAWRADEHELAKIGVAWVTGETGALDFPPRHPAQQQMATAGQGGAS